VYPRAFLSMCILCHVPCPARNLDSIDDPDTAYRVISFVGNNWRQLWNTAPAPYNKAITIKVPDDDTRREFRVTSQ
jgi:hypothetical protein